MFGSLLDPLVDSILSTKKPDASQPDTTQIEQQIADEQAKQKQAEAVALAEWQAQQNKKVYCNTALIYGELKQYGQAISQMHLYLTAAPEAPDAHTAQDRITKWELQQEIGGNWLGNVEAYRPRIFQKSRRST